MQDDLLPSHLCTALMRIGTRLATVFDQRFSRFGLTQAQFRLLLAICEAGDAGVTPSALADQLLIERAAVSVLTNPPRRARLAGPASRREPPHVPARPDRRGDGEIAGGAAARRRAGGTRRLPGFRREDLRGTLALLDQLETHLREKE